MKPHPPTHPHSLQILKLAKNRFKSIPGSVALLTKLVHFSMAYNRVEGGEEALAALDKMSRLNLAGNQLKSIGVYAPSPSLSLSLCVCRRLLVSSFPSLALPFFSFSRFMEKVSNIN